MTVWCLKWKYPLWRLSLVGPPGLVTHAPWTRCHLLGCFLSAGFLARRPPLFRHASYQPTNQPAGAAAALSEWSAWGFCRHASFVRVWEDLAGPCRINNSVLQRGFFCFSFHAWLCGVGAGLSAAKPVFAGGPAPQEAFRDTSASPRTGKHRDHQVHFKSAIKHWSNIKKKKPSLVSGKVLINQSWRLPSLTNNKIKSHYEMFLFFNFFFLKGSYLIFSGNFFADKRRWLCTSSRWSGC